MRKLVILLTVVIVLAGLAVSVVWVALGRVSGIVEREIERQGTEIAGTAVTVGAVDLSPFSGTGTITDLAVANPEGFAATPALLDVREAAVRLDPWTVLTGEGPVVVNDAEIREATLSVEASLAAMGSNLGTLKQRVAAFRADDGGAKTAPRRRVRLERFATKDVRVEVVFHGPLRTFSRTIRLDDIELRDVGGAEGAAPEELAREIATALAREAKAAIERSPGPLKEFRNKLLESLDERGGPGLEGLRQAGQDILDRLRGGDIASLRDLRDAVTQELSGADAGAARDADAADGEPAELRPLIEQTREKLESLRKNREALKRLREERRRDADAGG